MNLVPLGFDCWDAQVFLCRNFMKFAIHQELVKTLIPEAVTYFTLTSTFVQQMCEPE
jgi:hypothetical protein